MVFEPLDFISKLAALVPVPGANLIRFHGVFASNTWWNGLRPDVREGAKNRQKNGF